MKEISVHLCRPGDRSLGRIWEEKGGWEQFDDGPVKMVIGKETTDEKCARMAARFGLDVEDLLYFRENRLFGDGYRTEALYLRGRLA